MAKLVEPSLNEPSSSVRCSPTYVTGIHLDEFSSVSNSMNFLECELKCCCNFLPLMGLRLSIFNIWNGDHHCMINGYNRAK